MKAPSFFGSKRSVCPVFSIIQTILLLLPFSVFFQLNAQTYFFDDLNKGLGNFTTYDLDGRIPGSNVSKWFGTTAPNKGWYSLLIEGKDYAAFSTSSYSPAGSASDWLITTSPVSVLSAPAYLIWKATTWSSTNKDGYAVYISTAGNKPDDFTGNPVFSTAAENNSWTNHVVDLSAYVGKSIYIAFHNNSTAKYLLTVDNIFVGNISFTLVDNSPYGTYKPKSPVKAKLINAGSTITGFSAKFTANGKTFAKNYSGLNITAGSEFSFEFADSIEVTGVGNSVPYTLEVTSGSITQNLTGNVTLASFKPLKKVVVEEVTGTWCPYCPSGIVAMKKMKAAHKDSVIGIAVHNGDVMSYTEYDQNIVAFVDGVPSGVFDRKFVDSPAGFDRSFSKAYKEFAPASIELIADGRLWDSIQKIVYLKTITTFNMNFNEADFRIAFVVKENGVKGTSSGYNQRNAYAGSGAAMDGWELKPDPVPASQMVYDDVARKIYDSFTGIPGSVPATITRDQPLTFLYNLHLPASVTNVDKVEIIAMLIDQKSGYICNGDAEDFHDVGIESLNEKNISAEVRRSADQIIVDVETAQPGPMSTGFYTLEGKQIYWSSVSNENRYSFEIPASGLRGVYIIRVLTDEGVYNRKIVLE